jgi:hypothetical protein
VYLVMGEVGKLPFKSDPLEQALVLGDGAGASSLGLVLQEEFCGLRIGDGLGPYFAEGSLCEEPLGLHTGLGEGDNPIPTDGDTLAILLGAALGEPDAKARKGVVEIVLLALFWGL